MEITTLLLRNQPQQVHSFSLNRHRYNTAALSLCVCVRETRCVCFFMFFYYSPNKLPGNRLSSLVTRLTTDPAWPLLSETYSHNKQAEETTTKDRMSQRIDHTYTQYSAIFSNPSGLIQFLSAYRSQLCYRYMRMRRIESLFYHFGNIIKGQT